MSEQINNGKLDVMGINIDISQVLGQKIVDQYIAQLPEEQMKTIMDYVSKDLFSEESVYNYELGERVTRLKITERKKDNWGQYKTNEIPIGELIKNHFNNRINEELKKKVEEIIATDDYKQKVEEIANELIDYSINGYKEDMKNRIRERLVGNVMNTIPSYDSYDLVSLINQVIDSRLRQY
jgi:hypothetical protein